MEDSVINEIVEEVIADLDINFDNTTQNLEIITKMAERLCNIAIDTAHREDEKVVKYIHEALVAMWLRRGDEDKSSMSEGGESYTYKDIIAEMQEKLVRIRKLL